MKNEKMTILIQQAKLKGKCALVSLKNNQLRENLIVLSRPNINGKNEGCNLLL